MPAKRSKATSRLSYAKSIACSAGCGHARMEPVIGGSVKTWSQPGNLGVDGPVPAGPKNAQGSRTTCGPDEPFEYIGD